MVDFSTPCNNRVNVPAVVCEVVIGEQIMKEVKEFGNRAM